MLLLEAGAFPRSTTLRAPPDVQRYYRPAYALDLGWRRMRGDGMTVSVCDLFLASGGTIRLTAPLMEPPRLDPPQLRAPCDWAPHSAEASGARDIDAQAPLREGLSEGGRCRRPQQW